MVSPKSSQLDVEPIDCPLCSKPLDVNGLKFYPCACGYQICRFCWYDICTKGNGICVSCDKRYELHAATLKEVEKLNMENNNNDEQSPEKNLVKTCCKENILVVSGLPADLADSKSLDDKYFRKFGQIENVAFFRSYVDTKSQNTSKAYVMFSDPEDARKAMISIKVIEGHEVQTSLLSTGNCPDDINNMCMKFHFTGFQNENVLDCSNLPDDVSAERNIENTEDPVSTTEDPVSTTKDPVSTTEEINCQKIKWEQEKFCNLHEQIKYMYELPQIGQFLYLTASVLKIPRISQYQIERMLLMPQASTTLARLMTNMLFSHKIRITLQEMPAMSYKLWAERFSKWVDDWYKCYYKWECNTSMVFQILGLEPEAWSVLGDSNPLHNCNFHELTFPQRVCLLKCLCDNTMHRQCQIRNVLANPEDDERGIRHFGKDHDGFQYFCLTYMCDNEIRVYRQNNTPANTHKVCNKDHENDQPKPEFEMVCDSFEALENLIQSVCVIDQDDVNLQTRLARLKKKRRHLNCKNLLKNLEEFSNEQKSRRAEFLKETIKERDELYNQWLEFESRPQNFVDAADVKWLEFLKPNCAKSGESNNDSVEHDLDDSLNSSMIAPEKRLRFRATEKALEENTNEDENEENEEVRETVEEEEDDDGDKEWTPSDWFKNSSNETVQMRNQMPETNPYSSSTLIPVVEKLKIGTAKNLKISRQNLANKSRIVKPANRFVICQNKGATVIISGNLQATNVVSSSQQVVQKGTATNRNKALAVQKTQKRPFRGIPLAPNTAGSSNGIPSAPNAAGSRNAIPSAPYTAGLRNGIPSAPNTAGSRNAIPSAPNTAGLRNAIPSASNTAGSRNGILSTINKKLPQITIVSVNNSEKPLKVPEPSSSTESDVILLSEDSNDSIEFVSEEFVSESIAGSMRNSVKIENDVEFVSEIQNDNVYTDDYSEEYGYNDTGIGQVDNTTSYCNENDYFREENGNDEEYTQRPAIHSFGIEQNHMNAQPTVNYLPAPAMRMQQPLNRAVSTSTSPNFVMQPQLTSTPMNTMQQQFVPRSRPVAVPNHTIQPQASFTSRKRPHSFSSVSFEQPARSAEVFQTFEQPARSGEVFQPARSGEVFQPVRSGEVFQTFEQPARSGEVFQTFEQPARSGEVFQTSRKTSRIDNRAILPSQNVSKNLVATKKNNGTSDLPAFSSKMLGISPTLNSIPVQRKSLSSSKIQNPSISSRVSSNLQVQPRSAPAQRAQIQKVSPGLAPGKRNGIRNLTPRGRRTVPNRLVTPARLFNKVTPQHGNQTPKVNGFTSSAVTQINQQSSYQEQRQTVDMYFPASGVPNRRKPPTTTKRKKLQNKNAGSKSMIVMPESRPEVVLVESNKFAIRSSSGFKIELSDEQVQTLRIQNRGVVPSLL